MKRSSLLVATVIAATAAFAACSQTPDQPDPCPSGICGGDAGPTTNDGGTGDGGCVTSWTCTPWSTTGGGNKATRTCTDANACPNATGKPIEAVDLPALDMDFFKCNVMPILQAKCSMLGCHGTETGRALRLYARGRLRHAGETIKTTCGSVVKDRPLDGCIGSIECECGASPHTATEVQLNFDAARGFALDANGNPLAPGKEGDSDLVQQPIVGGKAHAGVHLFRAGDADDKALRDWISGKKLGQTCILGNNY